MRRRKRRRRRRAPLTHGRDAATWREEYAASLREGIAPPPDMRRVTGGGGTADRSLMSRLHEEPEHVRREIERKARSVAPLYNKGGLQYDGK